MPTDRQIYEHLTERGVLTGVQEIDVLMMDAFRLGHEYDRSDCLTSFGELLADFPGVAIPRTVFPNNSTAPKVI